MTAVWTSLSNLLEEIETRIEALTPNGQTSKPFKYRVASESEEADIREDTGKPRMFQLTVQPPEDYRYVGAETVGFEQTILIEITYPTSKSWPVAMADDIQLIRHDLITNNTTTTGIAGRWLNLERPPEIEPLGDGWALLQLPIYVLFDSTATNPIELAEAQ